MLSALVHWWLFERRRPKPSPPVAVKMPSRDAPPPWAVNSALAQANAADLANSMAFANGLSNAYRAEQSFSGKPNMAMYAPQVDAVTAIARLVPPEWGEPQLIPSNAEGHQPGWQKGVDLGYAARDPQWQRSEKQERAVRAAVEEFVGLCKGHKLTAWRVIEHYDIRLDAYRLRLDAWGPR